MIQTFNLIEHIDNYEKTSGSLWGCHTDIPIDYIANSESFKLKERKTGRTPADGSTKNVELVAPLKYLSNFWRTLEMPLINCEINLQLTWSENCVITNSTGVGTFRITNIRLYVSVITLSTQDNTKLLQQLNSGFKRTISWNKDLIQHPVQTQN